MDDIHVEEELRCGELIGDSYILGDVLGVGGMGIVYVAVQRSLGREVAVKMPRTDVSTQDIVHRRFHTEAAVASRLSHRHVVSVIDYGHSNGSPFLVMERVSGRLLGRLVRAHGALDPALAAELVAQVLEALAAAHDAGIVHADVKPDNVFVDREYPFARLFDFGVAQVLGREDESPKGLLYGTPDYMAPELIRGHRPSVASDIYSAGVMLFELLSGAPPFGGGQSHEVLARQLQMEPMPPSRARGDAAISPQLDALTMRALDKRAAARFPDARSFASQLRAAARLSLNAAAEPSRAVGELEQAMTLLCTWTNAGEPPRSIWCVYLSLSVLYAHLGDVARARRLAEVGYRQAVGASSSVGTRRARQMLTKLGVTMPATDDESASRASRAVR
jgi:serine/threonine-protein kinase